ncbi:MAG: FeoA family protein [Coriobacteriaceae bacterium]|nr:FeoA family protein [Coriobacteriaceae bacterium]
MKTLDELKVGESAVVVRLGGAGPLRRHLMDLGLIGNTPLKLVKVAPLGDPMELMVRGYSLSIRKEEARIVEVRPLDDPLP